MSMRHPKEMTFTINLLQLHEDRLTTLYQLQRWLTLIEIRWLSTVNYKGRKKKWPWPIPRYYHRTRLARLRMTTNSKIACTPYQNQSRYFPNIKRVPFGWESVVCCIWMFMHCEIQYFFHEISSSNGGDYEEAVFFNTPCIFSSLMQNAAINVIS